MKNRKILSLLLTGAMTAALLAAPAQAAETPPIRVSSYKGNTLEAGDTITLTTVLGTRTYAVTSVEKVSVNDSSGTAPTTDNRVTLYTCVMNQPEYRWKVTAVEG